MRGNGKCGYCEKELGDASKYCNTCKQLFSTLVIGRKLKRKTPRAAYKRILAKVKYLEVLEAMQIR